MISVKVEVKEKSLAQRFGKMPAAVLEGVKDGLTELGIELERDMKAAVPHKSGALKRSIAFQLRDAGLIPSLVVGALLGPPPYAGIKEYGGTIKPRNARFLTIPFEHGKAMTASGQPRFTARQLFADPEAFGYTGAFIAKGVIFGELRGKAYVERTTGRKVKGPSSRGGLGGKSGKWNIEPLFALASQVTQQAVNGGKGYVRTTFDDALKRRVHREKIDAAVKRKLAALGGGAS